jgi:hypothetical protein
MSTTKEIVPRGFRFYGLTGINRILIRPATTLSYYITDNTNNYLTINSSTPLITMVAPVRFGSSLQMTGVTAPANPAAGLGRLYKKATPDLGLYWKPEDSGPEYNLTVGTELDFKQATSTSIATTTSTTYTALTGMTLTTSNVRSKNYLIIFDAYFTTNTANRGIAVKIQVNGVDLPASEKLIFLARTGSAGSRSITTASLTTTPLASGVVITVQWRSISGAQVSVVARQLTLFGIS